jgi:hypothetical protein
MSARALTACALAALSGVLGSVAAAADIDVSVIHFGAGDVVRGGGPVAVQVEFRSALDKATEIEAAWEIPNADLDIAEYSRRIVLNPGQAQRRWLYGIMPPYAEGALAGSVFDLRLYELSGGVRVRDLGTARIGPGNSQNPTRALSLAADVFAVVGPRAAGLDRSQGRTRGRGRPCAAISSASASSRSPRRATSARSCPSHAMRRASSVPMPAPAATLPTNSCVPPSWPVSWPSSSWRASSEIALSLTPLWRRSDTARSASWRLSKIADTMVVLIIPPCASADAMMGKPAGSLIVPRE